MDPTSYIKTLEERVKTLEEQVKTSGRKKMTIEERRAKDRERKQKRYNEDPDKAREYGLSLYYKKKQECPDFHNKPVGRPRKTPTEDA
jgi:hypothetical protein